MTVDTAQFNQRREYIDKRSLCFNLTAAAHIFVVTPAHIERHFLASLVRSVFSASQIVGRALQRRSVVGCEHYYGIIQHSRLLHIVKQFAEIVVEFRDYVRVNSHARRALTYKHGIARKLPLMRIFVIGIFGFFRELAAVQRRVRPRSSVIHEKGRIFRIFISACRLLAADYRVNPAAYTFVTIGSEIFLVDRGTVVDNLVLAVALFYIVKGGHIVDVMRAVKIIEALICGEVFSVVAQMPFSESSRSVTCVFEYFRYRDFVSQHTVAVCAHLKRVVYSRSTHGKRGIYRRIKHVVGVASVRISSRHKRKTRRGTYRIACIKIFKIQTFLAYIVERRRGKYCISVERSISVTHIVHKYNKYVGTLGRRGIVFIIIVESFEVFVLALRKVESLRFCS